jgi:hypothetical protein
MTLEMERRARWNRTRDAAKSRGVELESAPAFLELIEEWIAGRITMLCVQEGFAALVRSRGKSSRECAPAEKNVLEEIFAEVPEVSGLISRAPQGRDHASDQNYSARNDASAQERC